MERNDVLSAGGGQYTLTFLNDGNLVLQYQGVQTTWQSGTAGSGAHVVMQGDGNLVIYNWSWAPVWATGTVGNPGAYLNVQDDGNLVVYSASNTPLWSIR